VTLLTREETSGVKVSNLLVPAKSGMIYFLLVFGAGFLLGPVRLLWAIPRFGVRIAELLEMPVMLAVGIVAARSIVRRQAVPPAPACRLGMGAVAFTLLVGAELGLARLLRGLSPREYVALQDPVSGAAFLAVLAVYALIPLLVARPEAAVSPEGP
jgi:hypothetical protein